MSNFAKTDLTVALHKKLSATVGARGNATVKSIIKKGEENKALADEFKKAAPKVAKELGVTVPQGTAATSAAIQKKVVKAAKDLAAMPAVKMAEISVAAEQKCAEAG